MANFETQFVASLRKFAKSRFDDENFYLRALSQDDVAIDPATRDDAFLPTLQAMARIYSNKALMHLESLYDATESPIEKAMLGALCIVAHEMSENVWYKIRGHEFGERERMLSNICIEPQARIGKYRVDFLVTFEDLEPQFKEGTDNGEYEIASKVEQIIVECDGHDFHEKTKEQARTDKQRDRALQLLGFHVFRFTGSELWADPIACGVEALHAGAALLKKKAQKSAI
jgi:very-short-patch-repair endonuclease